LIQEKTTMGMGLLLKTDWEYVTGEESSASLVASVAWGKLQFKNPTTSETLNLKYRCVSFGQGKGLPVGANWSNTSDPSGQFDNVGVVSGRSFSFASFPCHGYMIGAGASSGVVGRVLGMDVTGGGVTVVIFGIWPVFAAVKVWGLGRAAFPGAGLAAGLAVYEEE
jgi:hypothetical protein